MSNSWRGGGGAQCWNEGKGGSAHSAASAAYDHRGGKDYQGDGKDYHASKGGKDSGSWHSTNYGGGYGTSSYSYSYPTNHGRVAMLRRA